MFGLSLGKVLLVVAVVAVVWIVFRWLRRASVIAAHEKQPKAKLASEIAVKCLGCGVFMLPRRARACGRSGCPYGA